ncbi:MAG: hypothetical protein IPH31_24655 [Lewinellaceae bacterium]|nr:hypothetical protein [Lewinellaceae bacterium]
MDLGSTPLPTAPNTITWTIPAGATPGDYYAVLSIANSCGFSTDYEITITVSALPDVEVGLSDLSICSSSDVTLTFTDNAATGHFFSVTADLVDDNGTTVGAINYSGIPSGATDTYIEGIDFEGSVGGTVSLTNIVVTDETTNCESELADLTITVIDLPRVSITLDDLAICDDGEVTLTFTDNDASGHLFSIVADLVDDNGTAVGAINYSNIPSSATDTYAEGVDFEGSTGGTVSLTNIVVTDETTGCDTTLANLSITVNPYPVASFSVVPLGSICPGTAIEIYFNESAWPGGTEFTVGADVSPLVFGLDTLTFYDAVNGDHVDLIEGTDFTGDLDITQVWVTEPISGCSSSASNVSVNVLDAPYFEFSAASESDGPFSGNNSAGPNTLDVDFCAGQHLTLADYDDNGNVGYTSYYTTTGNVTYDGGPLPLSSGPSNTSFGSAATFFGSVYGGVLGYGLTTGTSGTINQIFVPYLDNDGSGTLTAGDCEGDTMFLNYHIHAIPTVTVSPSTDIELCNGTASVITFSGNYGAGAEYLWDNDNTDIGIGTDGDGNITFTATNNTNAPIVGNLTVTPSTDYCEGDPVSFTVTVYPTPTVSVTATVAGGDPQLVSNFADPNAIVMEFCAGESFSYSLFDAPAGVGFIEEIVAGTTNLFYDIFAIPVPRPPTNISPAGAAAFFAGTYGPYNLAPGETYGWMTETFTPYYDGNGDGDYDALTDCLGDPITITCKVYAPISLTITRNNPAEICSGDAVDYTFSTTSTELISFDLVLEENTNGGNPADLNDDNTLPDTLVGIIINSANPYNFTQAINNAVGSFDRGRVRARAINIAYADADVCTTADVNGQNTQVYPKPILEALDPLLSAVEAP